MPRRNAAPKAPRPKALSRHKLRLQREAAEIEELSKRIAEELPARGSMEAKASQFDELPISESTIKGVQQQKWCNNMQHTD